MPLTYGWVRIPQSSGLGSPMSHIVPATTIDRADSLGVQQRGRGYVFSALTDVTAMSSLERVVAPYVGLGIGVDAVIDAVLGEDIDLPSAERRTSAGRIAQAGIRAFIPFGGLIREVSGANGHERRMQEVILAGGLALLGAAAITGAATLSPTFETQAAASWNAWEILTGGVESAGKLAQHRAKQAQA